MLDKLNSHIETHFPFLKKKGLLLACSGGLDSMVLAHLLLDNGYNFSIAHCNYKLRAKDSDKDEEFVAAWATKNRIKAFFKTFDLSHETGSIQLKARELRYHWFQKLVTTKGFDHILTAHHLDDDLETFLINLSRGTGLDGLRGIPRKNQDIIRPLLTFSKAEILEFATANGITWREDLSNKDVKYLRNEIRHEIVPKLKELNPTFLSNFQQTQEYLDYSSQLLENYKEELKAKLFTETDGEIHIPISELDKLNPLNGYLHLLFRDFGFTQWEDLTHLLTAQSGKEVQSRTHRMIKDRDSLILAPIAKFKEKVFLLTEDENHIKEPLQLRMDAVDVIGTFSPNVIYVDKEKLNYPLKLRKWKIGDYFYPFGMEGRKKLSKFFKDEKYTTLQKESQWLLCSGDKIVWVLGKRLDDRFKVTGVTKEILKFTWVS